MEVQLDDVIRLAQVRRLVADGTAKALRENAGLSLVDAGRAAGTHATTIYRYESHERVPTGIAALRYGRFLAALLAEGVPTTQESGAFAGPANRVPSPAHQEEGTWPA